MKDIDRRLLWKQSTSDIRKRVDALLSDERERSAPKLMEIRIYTNNKPHSDEAKALLGQIQKLIDLKSQKKGAALEAAGSFLADMVRVSIAGENSYGFRPIGAGSFSGEAIGFRTFKTATEAFKKAGLVQVATARAKPLEAGCSATATSFTPTIGLRKLITDAGITEANFPNHFKRVKPRYATGPVRLKSKSTKTKGTFGDKTPGKLMKVDVTHPMVIGSKEKLDFLNRYLGGRTITPVGAFGSLFRQFNDGDVLPCNYDKGGRIYCEDGNYQLMSKRERTSITIDGKPVVEIDVSSCHLTIFHHFCGEKFDNSRDLFESEILGRPVFKKYIAQSLGSNGNINRWYDEYERQEDGKRKLVKGTDYQKLYPVGKVKRIVLKLLPIMEKWPDSSKRWADFHFMDSQIMLDTIFELASVHDIPALPIHDSILVPLSNVEKAKAVFADQFERRTGIRPRLTVRFPEETKPVSI